MRVLGIDPGNKRIGLALTDPGRRFASPHGVMDAHPRHRLQRRLQALLDEQEVELIVMGDPLLPSGEVGEQAEKARELAEWLRSWCGREVVQLDERMTSIMAERALLEADLRRSDRKAKRDAVAAAILLQSWLDAA
jgi:putative holliday junction resolvase